MPGRAHRGAAARARDGRLRPAAPLDDTRGGHSYLIETLNNARIGAAATDEALGCARGENLALALRVAELRARYKPAAAAAEVGSDVTSVEAAAK